MKLRVALLGYGRIARLVHLEVLTHLPDVALTAIAELDPDRRQEGLRRAGGAAGCADWREALARPDVDAVVVCLPNGLHADVAVQVISAGKHLYLEKPLAIDAEGAERALAAWRAASGVAMMGFNYRAHPLIEAARTQIRSGRIGQVRGVSTVFTAARRELPDWKRQRATGGGALLDKATHDVDLIEHLVGQPVREVSARVESRATEDDEASLSLRLAGGVLGQCYVSLGSTEVHRLEIHGTLGRLVVDRLRSLDVRPELAAQPASRLGDLAGGLRAVAATPARMRRVLQPGREPSYAVALARFAQAARNDRRAERPNLWDGYRSLRVVLAAEESARTGRTVALPELADEGPDRP